jgi:adenylate cyclase
LRFLPGALHFPTALVLAVAYFAVAYYAFAEHHTWLPLATPLLLQLPLATVLSFFFLYRDVQRERRNIREAFGYHLPVNVVDQIAKGMEHVTAAGEKVQGIVMATDAEQYTALSETLAPDALHSLMNDYYATLFKPISAHNGIVSDVVGDAAMAIWAKPTHSSEQYQLACLAALQIQTDIQEFNQAHPAQPLPTRIGLHSGDIVLGHVGALDHYEYRAIGDIVNTASRIEGINKLLGTRILLSESIKTNLTSLLCRGVGQFQLAGKQTAIRLFELIGVTDHIDAFHVNKISAFEDALALFTRGDLSAAQLAFARLIDEYGDGPSAFYHARCLANLEQRVHDDEGIIHVHEK